MIHTGTKQHYSCLVSYPSRVSTIILCNDKVAVNTVEEVSVSSDNTIRMNMTLPIDKTCKGEFRWKNKQPKEFVNDVTNLPVIDNILPQQSLDTKKLDVLQYSSKNK